MDVDAIKSEYSKQKGNYAKLKDEAEYILRSELKEADIPYHLLDGRVKTLDSVLGKAKRQAGEVETLDLDKIVDICGVRVICLFLSDVEKIGRIIEDKFEIESKDDKVLSKPQEEFGYLSVHYIGKLPPSFSGARYDEIKGMRFEIQVRTIAMHAWATISHYLDYKSQNAVPSELRKDFYGLSALFYLADSHFELFFRKGQEARGLAEEKVSDVSAMSQEEINYDTIAAYLGEKFPNRQASEPSAVSELVEELVGAGYASIGDMDAQLKRSEQALPLYENKHPPTRLKPDEKPEYTGVGAMRVSLRIADEEFLRYSHKLRGGGVESDYREFQKYVT